MSNQGSIHQYIKSFSGQANILTIPRVYVTFTKSHRAALFLNQCVYWSDRTKDPDGWFYKSYKDWFEELGLNQHAAETCIKTLTQGGWLETKMGHVGIRNTRFYRPVLDKIADSIGVTLADSTIAETAKVHQRKTIMSSIRSEITDNVGADAPNGKKSRPRNTMFDVLVEVTHSDPQAAGGYIGKTAAELSDYDPQDIRRWYSPSGWWYMVRCKDMPVVPVPSLSGIAKTVRLAAESDKPKVLVVR